MTTQNYNKIYGVKRTIWNSESYYEQDEATRQAYKQDIIDRDVAEDPTDDDLARCWDEDNDFYYDCERQNLKQYIDGCIIALGHRWSHYGAICGSGREGTKIIGHNIADILRSNGDKQEFWAEDYNINGRTADHDGSWNITYRVCKDREEAEKLQNLACLGKLDNADIMARTKSLYPYVAKIYGWPYRGSKKAS